MEYFGEGRELEVEVRKGAGKFRISECGFRNGWVAAVNVPRFGWVVRRAGWAGARRVWNAPALPFLRPF